MTNELLAMLLIKAKVALRVTTNVFDEEIKDLISAAYWDLEKTAGVDVSRLYQNGKLDALLARAILTYVKFHFGQPEDYDRIKRSYDEQKAQLQTAYSIKKWITFSDEAMDLEGEAFLEYIYADYED